jgi:hypothetical protein
MSLMNHMELSHDIRFKYLLAHFLRERRKTSMMTTVAGLLDFEVELKEWSSILYTLEQSFSKGRDVLTLGPFQYFLSSANQNLCQH